MNLAPTLQQASQRYIRALELAFEKGGPAAVREAKAELGRRDLYFLLRYLLHRKDVEREWVYQRCREVQRDPNGYLDLWAREHFKSTIITYALTIQDILNNPEITVGFFSFNRPSAKVFLRQIKTEFETNEDLKACYPDVLWSNPDREAPKWSEDDGITVKRKGNPKEQTIEAWGLVDSPPTGRHYKLMVYDDVVTQDSVTTTEMIAKVTGAWELSRNLGSMDGHTRYIGTRYHYNDTYRTMMDREAAKVRKHPATDTGKEDGKPVLLTPEQLAQKRKEQGPYTFGCQMLLDPLADTVQGFKREWLQFTEQPVEHPKKGGKATLNFYLIVDPANAKKADSDYTAAFVVGLGTDENYYIADMIRDRLSLTERAAMVFSLHKRWKPLAVGYEQYGMQADIAHLKDCMEREGYHFSITELGGKMPKADRIRRLVPLFESARIWFPESLPKPDYQGKQQDLVKAFVDEEYAPFPRCTHDDMLDCLSRILDADMNVSWPMLDDEIVPDRYARAQSKARRQYGSWMSM